MNEINLNLTNIIAVVLVTTIIGVIGIIWFLVVFQPFGTKTKPKHSSSSHLKKYGISIRIINTYDECISNINELLSYNPKILGFDCEWKPYRNEDKPNLISLLQISDNSICLLIRLKNIF